MYNPENMCFKHILNIFVLLTINLKKGGKSKNENEVGVCNKKLNKLSGCK